MLKTKNQFYYSKQYFLTYSETFSLRPFLNNFLLLANFYHKNFSTCNRNNKRRRELYSLKLNFSKNYPSLYLFMRLTILQRLAIIRNQSYTLKIKLDNSNSKIQSKNQDNFHTNPVYSSSQTSLDYNNNKKHNKAKSMVSLNLSKIKYNNSPSPVRKLLTTEKNTGKKEIKQSIINTDRQTKYLKLKKVHKHKILYASKYLLLNAPKTASFPFAQQKKFIKRPEHLWCIALAPMHLQGLEGIAKAFGKGKATVREWREKGAPIAYDGSMYFSEYNTLFAWFLNNEKIF